MNFQARRPTATEPYDPAAGHRGSTGAANLIDGCIGDVAASGCFLSARTPDMDGMTLPRRSRCIASFSRAAPRSRR